MEEDKLKPFENISHSDNLIVLDHIGGIAPNQDETDNPLFECYFTPLIPKKSQYSDYHKDKEAQFRAGISTGFMTNTYIGQCFQAGKLAKTKLWPPLETITYDIDTNDDKLLDETTLAKLPIHSNSHILSWKNYQPAKHTCYKRLNGRLIKTDHPKWQGRLHNHPQPFGLLINEIELIRFYYTNSPHSFKNIINGAFSLDRIAIDVINTIDELPRYIVEEDTHRFVYRHGYTREDALTLGRILFSPDNIAMKGAQRVKNQIDADRINNKYGNYGYPRTHFPFKDKTRLVLQGRRIKLQGEGNYAFLTSRIKQCSAPFPFNHLSYSDHISPENPNPEGIPFHFPPNSHKNNKSENHHDDDEKSVMNQPPNSLAESLYAKLGDRIFTAAKYVKETYHKERESRYKSSKAKIPDNIPECFNASTGAPTDTGTSKSQKITAKKFKPSTISPDLDTFIEILNSIKLINPTWVITTLTIGDGEQSTTQPDICYSYFPVLPCRVRYHTLRSFSFMDSGKQINKRFICAQLKADSQYLYLFECERRKNLSNTKNNNPYLNNSPVLLLFKPGFLQCTEDDFHEMAHGTVIRETWPKDEDLIGFVRDTIQHGKGAQSADEMASRILDKIAIHLTESYHAQ